MTLFGNPSIKGFILTLSTSLCHTLETRMESLSELFAKTRLYLPHENLVVQKHLFKQLLVEFQHPKAGRNAALESLVCLILIELQRSAEQGNHGALDHDKRVHYLHQFTQLIEQNFREQRPVSFYADKLSITPTHLNSLCREFTGRSSLALIHERLLLEIKRNLLYSDQPLVKLPGL